MKGKRRKRILVGAAALLLAAGIIFWMLPQKNFEKVAYREFYDMVGAGQILCVKVSEDRVIFQKTGEGISYVTDNPQTEDFREFLLLHDVEVEIEGSVFDGIYLFTDLLFTAVFFGLLFFLAGRLFKNRTFRVIKSVNAGFDDVVGMEGLKKEFTQIVDIMKNPEKYKDKGIRAPRGILLEGDPGNGKTLFARAAAAEGRISFIPAKATDFESMLMAVGPMKVKQLFRLARKHAPCIVFIDEFDGIGCKRTYGQTAMDTENNRIVTALLNELDGFAANEGVLVLAATNNRRALDEALIRPGRFDRKYEVPYPDTKDRIALIKMYTREKELSRDVEPEELAALLKACSCAKIEAVLNQAALLALRKGSAQIGRAELMIALAQVT